MKTMTVKTKFVITDTSSLESPAGVNLHEPIYRQTTIAIHCDEIPAKLPKTKGKLYAHPVRDTINKQWAKYLKVIESVRKSEGDAAAEKWAAQYLGTGHGGHINEA